MIQTPETNLKKLLGVQLGAGLVFISAATAIGGLQLGASFALGFAIMLGNLLTIGWLLDRLFRKKSFAWCTMVIVIKYPVLLGAIFVLAREPWFHLVGVGLGLASCVFTALIQGAVENTNSDKGSEVGIRTF